MGAYDRFKSATSMAARNYIVPGQHVFLIRKCSMGPSKNPQKKNVENTIVDLKIIKSNTMKAGEVTALVEVDTSQGYLGNVLAFVAGVLGCTEEEMKADEAFDAVFEGAFGVEQLCVGTLISCTAQKSATSDYTNKIWEPVKASEYAEYGLIAPDGAFTG